MMESRSHQVQRALLEEIGLRITVQVTPEAVILTGSVESAQERVAALDYVAALVPDTSIQNDLVIADTQLDVEDEIANPIEIEAPALAQALKWDDEEPETTFAPTDQVVGLDERGDLEILGGFSETSLDDVSAEPSASGSRVGDEALAEAIRRELREDASTTTLEIEVVVRSGVAHLRGSVPFLEDAEAAEEVASRVTGVRTVVDDLNTTG